MNKTLTLISDRCPSAGNDLVSARAGLKHFLGEGGEGKNVAKFKKWSLMQPVAEHLLDECLKGWKRHGDIISQEDRWSNPPEASLSTFCSDAELAKSMAKLLPQTNKSAGQIWGACYNMLHTKHMAGKSESPTAYMWDHILVFQEAPSPRLLEPWEVK